MSFRGGALPFVAIALVTFALAWGLRSAGWLEPLELQEYDWYLRLRPAPDRASDRITLIQISEEEVAEYGHPLSDDLLAAALEKLVGLGARTIGVDLYRDRPVAPGSGRLEAVLRGGHGIVLISKLPEPGAPGVAAPPYLDAEVQVGFSDILVDHDGVVRRGLLFASDGERVRPSFSLQLARHYLDFEGVGLEPVVDRPESLRLGRTGWHPFRSTDGGYVGADDGGFQVLLDYRGGPRPFLAHLLSDLLANRIPPEAIQDRLVLLGTTASSVKDNFFTPYNRDAQGGPVTYGVEIHAHLASQLLRGALEGAAGIGTLPNRTEAIWLFFWSALGVAVVAHLRSPVAVFFATAGGLALVLGSAFSVLLAGHWLASGGAGLAWLGAVGLTVSYTAWHERAERASLMRLFSIHVSSPVAEKLWRERHRFMAGGRPAAQQLTATVLFADIEGYVEKSSKLEPGALMDWLNAYTGAMVRVIEAHHGMVDDFLGDGIKANFGVPIPSSTQEGIDADAENAVRSALAMGDELSRLNREWGRRGLPEGRLRVGIVTGPVVAGSIGNAQRMKYTSVGDSVNTAARLESFDKLGFGSESSEPVLRILISEETHRRVHHGFEIQELGRFPIKGKDAPIAMYRVLGSKLGGRDSSTGPMAEDDTEAKS